VPDDIERVIVFPGPTPEMSTVTVTTATSKAGLPNAINAFEFELKYGETPPTPLPKGEGDPRPPPCSREKKKDRERDPKVPPPPPLSPHTNEAVGRVPLPQPSGGQEKTDTVLRANPFAQGADLACRLPLPTFLY
jgi:hypothetical protein